MGSIEQTQVPGIAPCDRKRLACDFDRKPHIASIDGVLWPPAICDEDERIRPALDAQHISALRAECQLRIFATAWIAKLLPWSRQAISNGSEGWIRSPPGCMGPDIEIVAVCLENGLSFERFVREDPDIVTSRVEIIVSKLRDVLRLVLFRRRDQVCLAVVVLVKGHVAGHFTVGTEITHKGVRTC